MFEATLGHIRLLYSQPHTSSLIMGTWKWPCLSTWGPQSSVKGWFTVAVGWEPSQHQRKKKSSKAGNSNECCSSKWWGQQEDSIGDLFCQAQPASWYQLIYLKLGKKNIKKQKTFVQISEQTVQRYRLSDNISKRKLCSVLTHSLFIIQSGAMFLQYPQLSFVSI